MASKFHILGLIASICVQISLAQTPSIHAITAEVTATPVVATYTPPDTYDTLTPDEMNDWWNELQSDGFHDVYVQNLGSLTLVDISDGHNGWSWMATFTDGNGTPFKGTGSGVFERNPSGVVGIGGGYILNWDSRDSNKLIPWISSANGQDKFCCSQSDLNAWPARNAPVIGSSSASCRALVVCAQGQEG